MSFSPEWIAIVLTALGMGGAAGVWIEKRLQANRSAMPIIRSVWQTGTGGQGARIEFVNRLDEDLHVTRVECKSKFVSSEIIKGGSPDEPKFSYTMIDSPRSLDFTVPANDSKKLSVAIDGAETPRWLRFTVSSSAKTLSKKRYVIRDTPA